MDAFSVYLTLNWQISFGEHILVFFTKPRFLFKQKFKIEKKGTFSGKNVIFCRAEAVPPAEFNSLRQKVSIMENELSNNCSKLNMSENAKRSLENKIAKYEEEIKKLKGVEVYFKLEQYTYVPFFLFLF